MGGGRLPAIANPHKGIAGSLRVHGAVRAAGALQLCKLRLNCSQGGLDDYHSGLAVTASRPFRESVWEALVVMVQVIS